MTDIKWLPHHTPEEVRICIYYEFLGGKPVFEAFKSLCGALGNDVISYVDFDYWFYRFHHGNVDLDYDRKNDPETRDLVKMPIQVIENIVNRLEVHEQFRLRKVSRDFRNFIDRKDVNCKTAILQLGIHGSSLKFADRRVHYDRGGNVTLESTGRNAMLPRSYYDDWQTYLTRPAYDLTSILMMEGLHLDTLQIEIDMEWTSSKSKTEQNSENIDKFYRSIASTNKILHSKCHVKKLMIKVEQERHVKAILPFLEPGALEEIEFSFWREKKYLRRLDQKELVQPVADFSVERIAEMEQWKQAKKIKIERFKIPIQEMPLFYHFNRFDVGFTRIDENSFNSLQTKVMANPNFEFGRVTSRFKIAISAGNLPVPGREKTLEISKEDKSINLKIVEN